MAFSVILPSRASTLSLTSLSFAFTFAPNVEAKFTQDLQVQFQQKLLPVIEQVAKAKNLHFILSIADAGVVWVDAGLNVTADVVAALDAATPAAK